MELGRERLRPLLRLAQNDEMRAFPLVSSEMEPPSADFDLNDVRNSLTSLMWRCAGVRREADQLEEAKGLIQGWCRYVLPCQFDSTAGWELQNMLVVARLVVDGAMQRAESRGVHLRVDYPETDDANWLCHINFQGESSYLSPV